MHINKIAKMIIGVNNIVVEDINFDEMHDCIVISARPTRWHFYECGKCGCKAPFYDSGRGKRRWRCTDIGNYKCYVEADAFRVDCPNCGPTVRKFSQVLSW